MITAQWTTNGPHARQVPARVVPSGPATRTGVQACLVGRRRLPVQVVPVSMSAPKPSRSRRRAPRWLAAAFMALFSAAVPASVETLGERYAAAVQWQVQINWMAPAAAAGVDCVLMIEQATGGEVLSAHLEEDCSDKAVHASLKRAAWRASPLPYNGFESVFQSHLRVHFIRAGDHI